MKSIRGKKALITGAASGIGRCLALEFAGAGADLWLLDIDAENLDATAAACRQAGANVSAHPCDLNDRGQISAAVQTLLAEWGGLDILVNNAAIACYGPTELVPLEMWDKVLAINLHGPIQLTHKLLPALLKSPQAHIVNMCSAAGILAMQKMAAYNVSKAAMICLTESLRAEYSRRGMGVTAICPGFVRTNMLTATKNFHPGKGVPVPPGWTSTTPERVAKRVMKAIRREEGVVIITAFARFMWRVKRLSPFLWDVIARDAWFRKWKRKRPK